MEKLKGKIVVEYFLNKRLKSFEAKKGTKGVSLAKQRFPLYIQVRFQKKQSQFKSEFHKYLNQDPSNYFFKFIMQNLKLADKDPNHVQQIFLSETEFNSIDKQEYFAASKSELKAIYEIFDLFRNNGYNLIELSAKKDILITDIINEFTESIDTVISAYLSFEFYTRLENKYEDLDLAIWDFNNDDFLSSFKFLDMIGSDDFRRDCLNEFRAYAEFLQIVKSLENLDRSKFSFYKILYDSSHIDYLISLVEPKFKIRILKLIKESTKTHLEVCRDKMHIPLDKIFL
jgi:hypothetical protein